MYSEVEKAIRELKNNKNPGCDDIAVELIKKGGENVTCFFHKLCTAIWISKKWPDDWVKSIFIPIPKKGDVQQCSNNRTIALICHCSKILLTIITGRITVKLEEEISEEQAGFRSGKGTRDHCRKKSVR